MLLLLILPEHYLSRTAFMYFEISSMENKKFIFVFAFLPDQSIRKSDKVVENTSYMDSLMHEYISTFLLLFRIRYKGRHKTWAGCLICTHKNALLTVTLFCDSFTPLLLGGVLKERSSRASQCG